MKKNLFIIAIIFAIGLMACSKQENFAELYYPDETRSTIEAEQESSIIITEAAACKLTNAILDNPETSTVELFDWIPQRSFKRTMPFHATGLGETFDMRGIIVPLIDNNNKFNVEFDSRYITLDGSYAYGKTLVFRYNVRTICKNYESQTWLMVIAGMESSFNGFLERRQKHFEKYEL